MGVSLIAEVSVRKSFLCRAGALSVHISIVNSGTGMQGLMYPLSPGLVAVTRLTAALSASRGQCPEPKNIRVGQVTFYATTAKERAGSGQQRDGPEGAVMYLGPLAWCWCPLTPLQT